MIVSTPPAFASASSRIVFARGPLPVEHPRVIPVVRPHRHQHVLVAQREAESCVIDRPEHSLYDRQVTPNDSDLPNTPASRFEE